MAGISLEAAKLRINYTSLEFFSLVDDQRQLITDRFPQITDYNTASLVEMQIELFASIGDRLYLMQNKQANEVILVTAKRRKNIINGAKSIGYIPRTAKAATGSIRVTLDAVYGSNTLIPRHTLILTKESGNPQTFRTTADILVLAGQTTANGPIKHSRIQADTFDTTLEPNQRYRLTERPFLDDGSMVVTIDGEEWEQVDNFLDSTGASLHYTVEVDENDYGYIVFGDGINGVIPAELIDVAYETGGGVVGNQASGTITVNADSFTTNADDPVKVTFTNPDNTEGGLERETAAEIKIRAPRSLKTISRTICREDFSINIENHFDAVARSIAFSRPQDAVIPAYTAWVYVVPVAGGNPSTELRDQIAAYLQDVDGAPIPMGMALEIKNPIYQSLALHGTVVVDPTATLATVKAQVMAALRTYFGFQSMEANYSEYTINFGQTVRWSRVLHEITRQYGVRYVTGFQFNALDVGADLTVAAKAMPLLNDSNFDATGGLEFEVMS